MSNLDEKMKRKLLKPHRLARGTREPLRDAMKARVTPTRVTGRRFGAVGMRSGGRNAGKGSATP